MFNSKMLEQLAENTYLSRKTQKTNQANIKTQKIENRAGNVTVPATTT